MANYLITGVAGSGKSTQERRFRAQGYQTIDIDDGLAEWRDIEADGIVSYNPNDPDWHNRTVWSLRADALQAKLAENQGDTFVFGSTRDLFQYVSMFTRIFLLRYSDHKAIVSRLSQRVGGYGANEYERDLILSYADGYQDTMMRAGAVAIDALLSEDEIAKTIKQLIQADI